MIEQENTQASVVSDSPSLETSHNQKLFSQVRPKTFSPTIESALDRGLVPVSVESIPSDLVEEVFIPDFAKDMIPASHHHLIEKDNLIKWLMASTGVFELNNPSINQENKHVLTYLTEGRATTLFRGIIPFADTIGMRVTEKGSWLSGSQLASRQGLINADHARPKQLGLLTNQSIKHDYLFAENAIPEGFRSSLPIGHCVLNKEGYKTWLVRQWGHNKQMQDEIKMSFSALKEDDLPVIMYRIAGIGERYCMPGNTINPPPNRISQDLQRSAKTMIYESERTKLFSRYLEKHNSSDQSGIIRSLTDMSNQIPLNESGLANYLSLICSIFATNIEAIMVVNRKYSDRNMTSPILPAFDAKDIDLSHMFQDYDCTWEDSRSTRNPEHSNAASYTVEFGQLIVELIKRRLLETSKSTHPILTPGIEEKFSKDFSDPWFWSDRISDLITH